MTAGKSGGWYQGFVLHAHDVVATLREGTSGLTVATGLNDIGALTRFSAFLDQAAPTSPRWPESTGRCWNAT